jgi:DASH complex subunit Duo1
MADRKAGVLASTPQDEDIDESLWDSPMKPAQKPTQEHSSKTGAPSKPKYQDQEVREQALRQELASMRKVNETIEGVIQSLDKAKTNMKV